LPIGLLRHEKKWMIESAPITYMICMTMISPSRRTKWRKYYFYQIITQKLFQPIQKIEIVLSCVERMGPLCMYICKLPCFLCCQDWLGSVWRNVDDWSAKPSGVHFLLIPIFASVTQGSMLWSLFSHLWSNFSKKLQYFYQENVNFSANFFGENI
jgi:hypothetical protein